MKIECYLSLTCGSEDALRENVRIALALEAVNADVSFRRISNTEANALGLRGSPSVLIDGTDIQPANVEGFS